MAITYTDNGGGVANNSKLEFTYTFPVLQTEDVKVALNAVVQATTKYAVDTASNPTKITFNNTSIDSNLQESTGAPKLGVTVRVFRQTTVGKTSGDDDPKAVYAAGSSIRAVDLNANQEQALYAIHELQDQPLTDQDISDGAITSVKILDGAIVNADVNASAAVAGTKISPDFGSQNIATTGTVNSVTPTELAILDGATVSTAELNILDGVTSTAAELNILDGVTATATELNLNDGQTATPTEVNILDGATVNTSEINKLDGFTGSTTDLNEVVAGKNVVETITGSATDAQIPTAQAVNERVVELVTEVGGFFPIANETSFPTTNPDVNDGAGTIVSIKTLASNLVSNGSGVATISNGAGSGNTVTINGLANSTTYAAGKGLLVETTSTLHTYTFHRETFDTAGITNAQNVVTGFNERYYGPFSANQATKPSGANRVNGDLYFNTSDGKMKVFNGSHASGTWDDMAAPGQFFINTLSSSSGSGGGSATFNGTATRFTLSSPPGDAAQLLVSVNGVIQKPNSGTSPSEGFAIDSADIIFASAPASGASFFIVTIGSSVNIGTPSNNTVTSAKIVDGTIVNGDISSSAAIAKAKLASLDIVNADINASAAIASSKLAKPIDLADNEKIRLGTDQDLEILHTGSSASIINATGLLKISAGSNANYIQSDSNVWITKNNNAETMAKFSGDGSVELYHDNSKKFETTSSGVLVTGSVTASAPVAWHGEQDTAQSVATGSYTRLRHLGNAVVNTTGWDESNGVFTVPAGQAGAYQLSAGAGIDDVQANDYIRIGFSINDASPPTVFAENRNVTSSNAIVSATTSQIKYLNAGDTVHVEFLHNEGSTEPSEENRCWFSGHRIN